MFSSVLPAHRCSPVLTCAWVPSLEELFIWMLTQGKEDRRNASTGAVCFINSSCLLWSAWVNRQTDTLITAKGREFISSRLGLTAGKSRYYDQTSLAFSKVFHQTCLYWTFFHFPKCNCSDSSLHKDQWHQIPDFKWAEKGKGFFLIVTNFHKNENGFPVGSCCVSKLLYCRPAIPEAQGGSRGRWVGSVFWAPEGHVENWRRREDHSQWRPHSSVHYWSSRSGWAFCPLSNGQR